MFIQPYHVISKAALPIILVLKIEAHFNPRKAWSQKDVFFCIKMWKVKQYLQWELVLLHVYKKMQPVYVITLSLSNSFLKMKH